MKRVKLTVRLSVITGHTLFTVVVTPLLFSHTHIKHTRIVCSGFQYFISLSLFLFLSSDEFIHLLLSPKVQTTNKTHYLYQKLLYSMHKNFIVLLEFFFHFFSPWFVFISKSPETRIASNNNSNNNKNHVTYRYAVVYAQSGAKRVLTFSCHTYTPKKCGFSLKESKNQTTFSL